MLMMLSAAGACFDAAREMLYAITMLIRHAAAALLDATPYRPRHTPFAAAGYAIMLPLLYAAVADCHAAVAD